MSKEWKLCSECGKEMQRCRASSVDSDGNVIWVCRRCWKELNYDSYLYEHLKEREQNV